MAVASCAGWDHLMALADISDGTVHAATNNQVEEPRAATFYSTPMYSLPTWAATAARSGVLSLIAEFSVDARAAERGTCVQKFRICIPGSSGCSVRQA